MVKTHLLGRSVRETAAIRRHAAQLPKYTGAFEVHGPGTANAVVIRVPADIDPSQRRTINVKNIKVVDNSVSCTPPAQLGTMNKESHCMLTTILDESHPRGR
jgi:hypothetical protein